MDTISKLYHGNLSPMDRRIGQGSPLQKQIQRLAEDEERLREILAEKEKDLFEDYVSCSAQVLSLCEEDKFIIGFRMGARLTLDVFARDDAHTENLIKE